MASTHDAGQEESLRYKHLTPMLCVRDLGVSVAFYRRFGFQVAMQEAHIALLTLNDLRLYLFTESPPTEDKPNVRLVPQVSTEHGTVIIVFGVDDCRATHAVLSQRGVSFLTPPKAPPWGGWRCFAQDPDGYLVEIEES